MNKNRFAIALVVAFLVTVFTSLSFAADPPAAPKLSAPAPSVLTLKQEAPSDTVNVDLFGTYRNHGTYGEGLGVSYFVKSWLGVGVEAQFDGVDKGKFPDQVNLAGNIILRSPATILNLRPYAFVGGGRPIGDANYEAHVGAGLEFRLARNLGLFGDYRYVWDVTPGHRDTEPDDQQVRVGARLNF